MFHNTAQKTAPYSTTSTALTNLLSPKINDSMFDASLLEPNSAMIRESDQTTLIKHVHTTNTVPGTGYFYPIYMCPVNSTNLDLLHSFFRNRCYIERHTCTNIRQDIFLKLLTLITALLSQIDHTSTLTRWLKDSTKDCLSLF
jgi:hypothetical protein